MSGKDLKGIVMDQGTGRNEQGMDVKGTNT
jgi:hypothetical protein